jgi:transposase
MRMEEMDAIYERVGGLDVHKKSVVACRRRLTSSGRCVEKEVATFGTTTSQLLALLAWLKEWDVTQVAMESTGVYWKPVWHILEGHVEQLLVNARHLKTVPGRKSDVKDCEWIAQLMQYGLLRGSFVPSPEVRQWRDLTRHRTKLIGQRTAVVNRIHKVLEDANVKLSSVISDIMGVSGLRMLRAMVSGESDAEVLSQLGDPKLRASQAALQESLQGKLSDHHRFMLAGLLEQVTFLNAQIARLDERLEEQMRPFEEQIRRLDTIDGIDRVGAQSLLAELGPDMGQFPDADHLSSWAGMSPGNDESAGKRRSGKTTKGNKWLRRTLTQAAWGATKRKGRYLSAQYRRLASRRGKNRAIVAVGHTILVAAYYILKDGVEYHDLGGDHFDRLRRERTVSHLVRRLQRLGYNVSLEAIESDAA